MRIIRQERYLRDLDLSVEGNVVTARFNREVILSGDQAEDVSNRLIGLMNRGHKLLVDFGNVKSLSSLMLGKLVKVNHAADAAGVHLYLFNVRPEVREILHVTGLTRILRVVGTEDEALQGT